MDGSVVTYILLVLSGAVFGCCMTLLVIGFWAAHEVSKQDQALSVLDLMNAQPNEAARPDGVLVMDERQAGLRDLLSAQHAASVAIAEMACYPAAKGVRS